MIKGFFDTYLALVKSGQLLGSKKSLPLFTQSSSVVPVDNASLIDIGTKTIASNTETILLTIKNKETFNGKTNTTIVSVSTLTLNSDGNKRVVIKLYKNGVTGGTYSDWNTSDSLLELSTDNNLALTTTTVAGITKINEQVGGTLLAKQEKERINFIDTDVCFCMQPGEILTITAESTQSNEIDMQIRIKER